MEKKSGLKKTTLGSEISAPEASRDETVDSFLTRCIVSGRLKAWQRKELAVFFKDLNLREKEKPEVFEQALKRY